MELSTLRVLKKFVSGELKLDILEKKSKSRKNDRDNKEDHSGSKNGNSSWSKKDEKREVKTKKITMVRM